MENKGQMFLITAIIIIVILVLLRTSINIPEILQKEKELKTRFEKEFFQNTVDELVKVIDISYHQPSNITDNVFSFANFTRKKMAERLQDFNFFYVNTITPVSQGSDTMNVTIVNLLNKNTSVILNLNGTIKRPTTVTTTAVDINGDVGQYSSIAIDSNDKVHISHYNTTNLRYLRYCNNTLGYWTCTIVESTGAFGWYPSIAIDSNDKVHISYLGSGTGGNGLRYCNNTLGYWTCTEVETGGSIGQWPSIAIDSNDKVHISHGNSTDFDLRYCNNTLGYWTCTNVDTTLDVGRYSSIVIDSNDKVHISHYNISGSSLRYCNNTLGYWTCTEVETTSDVGSYSSIAIDSNNKVHISHYNATGGDLRYCNNTLGTWTCINVETSDNVGSFSSIVIDSNDRPHISHYDNTNNALRYCYTEDFFTWNCQKVTDTGGSINVYGRGIAIKKGRLSTSSLFSPNVHISYYNATTKDLMYAKIAFEVKDSSSWVTNFSITQGNNYILTTSYDSNQENITVGTKINKSVYVGFFDITLTGSETTYKDKFQKNYTLP